jgi:hypothetical protein
MSLGLNSFDAKKSMDVFGRLKVSRHQNIYDADFEYGTQPLRWESYTQGAATIAAQPNQGGVGMTVTTSATDVAIRQSRPYHRYQPGKSMYMASAVLFGGPFPNQFQRVGFFDDSNGAFFEQGTPTDTNPSGMFVVVRSDVGGTISELRVPQNQWNGDASVISIVNWYSVQMINIEYAWYGAGMVRFGLMINGEPIFVHSIGFGNKQSQTVAWARTGNLPVRYELRNSGTTAAATTMTHWGVSVMVEGQSDEQRGFTYAYGMALGTPQRTVGATTTRYPVLSIRNRVMGTLEYTQASSAITSGTTTSVTVSGTPWTVNQWIGRFFYNSTLGFTARIVSNTANVLTLADIVTGGVVTASAAGNAYTIGLINRGLILPLQLNISSTAVCTIELISSTTISPVVLTGSNFAALTSLGSTYSFAERDVTATALSGGEVVYSFLAPAGGSGLLQIDLSNFFPLYNTILGNKQDILTVAVSTGTTAASIGASIVAQEKMS